MLPRLASLRVMVLFFRMSGPPNAFSALLCEMYASAATVTYSSSSTRSVVLDGNPNPSNITPCPYTFLVSVYFIPQLTASTNNATTNDVFILDSCPTFCLPPLLIPLSPLLLPLLFLFLRSDF